MYITPTPSTPQRLTADLRAFFPFYVLLKTVAPCFMMKYHSFELWGQSSKRSRVMLTFLLLLFFINIHPTNSETTNFIRFSGDAMHDFPNTSIVIVDEGNNVTRAMFDLDRIRWYGEPSDVVMPSTLANMRSGWDMRQVLVAYDAESDVMHFGIVFYGIAGDADGDGNASSTSGPLAMLNGVDRPALEGTEVIAILIDPEHFGNASGEIVGPNMFSPTLIITKPTANGVPTSVQDYAVYSFDRLEGDQVNINIKVGGKVASVIDSALSDPMLKMRNLSETTFADFELAVPDFSKLPGITWTPNGLMGFSFVAYAGSSDDADIGYDLVPNEVVVENGPENNLKAVVGATVIVPCEGVISADGICCPTDLVDFCGKCRGHNEEMDSCGICGGTTDNATICPGTVAQIDLIDLSLLDIPDYLSIVVATVGDIDGNGVADIAIGVPGLESNWKSTHKLTPTQAGQVFIVMLDENFSIKSYIRLYVDSSFNSSALHFVEMRTQYDQSNATVVSYHFSVPLEADSLFGFSVSPVTFLNRDRTSDLLIGAPNSNGTGTLHILFLNSSGLPTSIQTISPPYSTAQVGNTTEGSISSNMFGTAIGSLMLDEARVFIVASGVGGMLNASRFYIEPSNMTTSPTAVALPGVSIQLIVVSVDAKVLGTKQILFPVSSSIIQQWAAKNSKIAFGGTFSVLSDLDDNGISELAIVVIVDGRPMILIAYLTPAGDVNRLALVDLPHLSAEKNKAVPFQLASIGTLADNTVDLIIGDFAGSMNSQGQVVVALLNSNGDIANHSSPVQQITSGSARFLRRLPSCAQFGSSIAVYNESRILVSADPLNRNTKRLYLLTLNSFSAQSTPTNDPDDEPDPTPAGSIIILLPDTNSTITLPPNVEAETSPISVSYLDGTPNHVIKPKNNNKSRQSVTVIFEKVEEVSANGTVVNQFAFPTTGSAYLVTTLAPEEHVFKCDANFPGVASTTSVTISTILFDTDKLVVLNDDIVFRVLGNSNKFTLKLRSWPFVDPASSLFFYMSLNLSTPVTDTASYYSTAERVTRYEFSTPRGVVRLAVPHVALIDGSVVPIMFTASVLNPADHGLIRLQFEFSAFKQLLEYDPDISISEKQQNSSSVAQDDASVIWQLFVAVGGSALLIILILVIVIAVQRHRRNARAEKRWREAAELKTLPSNSLVV